MKRIKMLIIIGILAFSFIIVPIRILATAETTEQPDIVADGESWLAKQLETYGVPSAISAIISAFGVSGALWIFTKLFRRKNKEIVDGLKQLGLSEKALEKTLLKLAELETKFEAIEQRTESRLNEFFEKDVTLLTVELKSMYKELVATNNQLQNGALKIINLLTEPKETEKDAR